MFFLNEADKVEEDVIKLISDIFDTICGDNEKSARIAASTIEFQRFIHIYNNINLYDKCSDDDGITNFERELIKRALKVDVSLLDKAFKVAPLHIKLKMIDIVNIESVLKSDNLTVVNYAIDNILDDKKNYPEMEQDLLEIKTNIVNIDDAEVKSLSNKDKEKRNKMIGKIELIFEDLHSNSKGASRTL